MSKKSRSRPARSAIYAQPIEYLIHDSATNRRVGVAPPVFQQLRRRCWIVQTACERHQRHGQTVTRYIAVLAPWLALRSAALSAEGNLQFASLVLSDGASIRSAWEIVERAWALDPRAHCPHTLEEVELLKLEREAAITDECRTWGLPEHQPLKTGFYLTPEAAAAAIANRQRSS